MKDIQADLDTAVKLLAGGDEDAIALLYHYACIGLVESQKKKSGSKSKSLKYLRLIKEHLEAGASESDIPALIERESELLDESISYKTIKRCLKNPLYREILKINRKK